MPRPHPPGLGDALARSGASLGGVVPYVLFLPVVLLITAVLVYPLYKLGTLSLQQYGLFELIQRKGKWIGFDNYRRSSGQRLLAHVGATVIFTIANVTLTIVLGTLIAFLLVRVSTWVRMILTSGLVLVWSMPAWSRSRSGTG